MSYNGLYTIPLFNWERIHTLTDYGYVLKKYRAIKSKKIRVALAEIWKRIYNEFLKEFGIGEQYEMILQQRKKIALLYAKKIATGDRSIETFIEIAEFELNQMQEENKRTEQSFYESKANIEHAIGFAINPHVVSAGEFFSYVNVVKKQNANGRIGSNKG